ncbi:hypothetical protein EJ03DRAFT_332523 [Teratosphaeria nubilosa]|uniref:Uncharacterized protein n=1 Tax=Teratosphaeria nubilosa TaxID=161662 RepID=A0A6G1KSS1_9PEZI|nr:hypothetical protein EJ03DRAFT_332523 [Teratosphaeria nubilosa]
MKPVTIVPLFASLAWGWVRMISAEAHSTSAIIPFLAALFTTTTSENHRADSSPPRVCNRPAPSQTKTTKTEPASRMVENTCGEEGSRRAAMYVCNAVL